MTPTPRAASGAPMIGIPGARLAGPITREGSAPTETRLRSDGGASTWLLCRRVCARCCRGGEKVLVIWLLLGWVLSSGGNRRRGVGVRRVPVRELPAAVGGRVSGKQRERHQRARGRDAG